MSILFDAGRELQTFFELQDWRFCFIGGIAVLRWGEPRFTRDLDVTLLCPFGHEDEVTTPMLAAGYTGRIPDAAALRVRIACCCSMRAPMCRSMLRWRRFLMRES